MRSVYVITCSPSTPNLIGVYTNLKKVHVSLTNCMDTPPDYPSLVADFKDRSPETITINTYTTTRKHTIDVFHMLPNSMP